MKYFIAFFVTILALSGCSQPDAYLQNPVQVQKTIGVDLDGNSQNIDQYQGRVVLIDFWATWCGPCLVKFPHMRELEQKYEGRPFEILGISADYALSDVTMFMEDNDLPWDIWFAGFNQGVVKDWNITAFPTVYVMDHTGMIIAKNPTNTQLENMLGELVSNAERAAIKE